MERITTQSQKAYGNATLFTKEQIKQINERWAKGDKSVLVMKAMLDESKEKK